MPFSAARSAVEAALDDDLPEIPSTRADPLPPVRVDVTTLVAMVPWCVRMTQRRHHQHHHRRRAGVVTRCTAGVLKLDGRLLGSSLLLVGTAAAMLVHGGGSCGGHVTHLTSAVGTNGA